MRVLWAIPLCLVVACTTTPVYVPVETVLERTVEIDPTLLEPCDERLSVLTDPSLEAVLAAHARDVEIHACSWNKHKELADLWVKTFKRGSK